MMAQSHTSFVHELFQTDTVRVRVRVVDVDEKRLHMFSEMLHATEGWLAATQEWMFLHLDMSARRVSPWPPEIRERLEALKAGVRLPPHKNMGRTVAIPRKG
jgi:acyl-CoA thioester hydrolase